MKIDVSVGSNANANDNTHDTEGPAPNYNSVPEEYQERMRTIKEASPDERLRFVKWVYLYVAIQTLATTICSLVTLIPSVRDVIKSNFSIFVTGLAIFFILQILMYFFARLIRTSRTWCIISFSVVVFSIFLILIWVAAILEPKVVITWTLDILVTLGILALMTLLFSDDFKLILGFIAPNVVTLILLIGFSFAFHQSLLATILFGLFMFLANCYIVTTTWFMLNIYGDEYEYTDYFYGGISFYHYSITIFVYLIKLCNCCKNGEKETTQDGQRQSQGHTQSQSQGQGRTEKLVS